MPALRGSKAAAVNIFRQSSSSFFASIAMPFSRKTPRILSRHWITLPDIEKANGMVVAEMERLGFWHKRLDDIVVYLVPLSFRCYGWFLPDGHIYIPAVNGSSLGDLIAGQHTRLTDVLRHEWAHALADRRPRLVSGRRFRQVFGADYESTDPVWEYHPDLHLTPYAASMPCEDFAETFHFYLRHKGRLPRRLAGKPEIIRKWNFIRRMAEITTSRR